MVIYLTGAPATGKSTLATALAQEDNRIRVFQYGREMARHLTLTRSELRSGTNKVVREKDIYIVNEQMKEWIESNRIEFDLVIDAHQVTIEKFGFRIAPFSSDYMKTLCVREIWVLSASPNTICDRISTFSEGRAIPSLHLALMHSYLQESLAVTYATNLGIESYIFNSELPALELQRNARNRLALLRSLDSSDP